MHIYISIGEQKLRLFEGDALVAEYVVSRPGTSQYFVGLFFMAIFATWSFLFTTINFSKIEASIKVRKMSKYLQNSQNVISPAYSNCALCFHSQARHGEGMARAEPRIEAHAPRRVYQLECSTVCKQLSGKYRLQLREMLQSHSRKSA